MTNKLQQYFTMIRSREEVLKEIRCNSSLCALFDSWTEDWQEEFLDVCTGVRGAKLLYDSFFKELMSPEYTPERLSRFLTLLMKRRVRVVKALPNDTIRIAEEGSLLITDIVVELENGELANVEIQKLGYAFPGERAACYSADLLLRQYKRVRDHSRCRQVKFHYGAIKTVYTIVIFEKSPREFRKNQKAYIHYSQQRADTGLEMELLQKYIFIPLDIFCKITHDRPIENELEAWLAFFAYQDPERILALIESYPEFRELYMQVYEICQNMEKVMGMFSKELQELDRNTVQYMIDELQEELDSERVKLIQAEKDKAEAQKERDAARKDMEAMERKLQEIMGRLNELEGK